jgi:pyridoxine 5-phosphate synthase
MQAAKATGTDRVELYTGPYGACYDDPKRAAEQIGLLGETADAAHALGLAVNAGHDLTVDNLPALAKRIPHLAEVSIGHALTADALIHGMERTVKRYLKACGT